MRQTVNNSKAMAADFGEFLQISVVDKVEKSQSILAFFLFGAAEM